MLHSHQHLRLLVFIAVIALIYITEIRDISEEDEDIRDYKAVLDWRVSKLKDVCRKHLHQMTVQHSSLYHRQEQINKCTTSFFTVDGKNHMICNVLKGGSTSWKMFFDQMRIPAILLADCKPGECSRTPQLRIVQVRHPMERLLSTWRHLFKNGGWRSLDHTFRNYPSVQKQYETLYSNISWPVFVQELVLGDKFHKTEEEMEDIEGGGVWIKHHWAPYWYTCGLCREDLVPDLILKTETLHLDIPAIIQRMNLPNTGGFPDIRTTGIEDNFDEGNNPTEVFLQKYFSMITKTQVMELYNMYRLDHLIFNYSPQKYIDIAQ